MGDDILEFPSLARGVIIAGLDPAILFASLEEDARVKPGHDERAG